MKHRGIARGSFRSDSRKWDVSEKMSKPTAEAARGRMIGGLTDSIVHEVMGGSLTAEKQRKEYSELIDNIKKGKCTIGPSGSMADAARERMIGRDSMRNRIEPDHPDIGKDRANRKAYPPKS